MSIDRALQLKLRNFKITYLKAQRVAVTLPPTALPIHPLEYPEAESKSPGKYLLKISKLDSSKNICMYHVTAILRFARLGAPHREEGFVQNPTAESSLSSY
jgi:hypothetical protein